MSNMPIGVFDSGIGGLSTLRELTRQLPNENFIYIADPAYAPYGNKPVDILQRRCRELSQFLLAQHCKAIVIACNTATAAAVATLRAELPIPIIGVEPGIKPAIEQSTSGIVGVLATERTLCSGKFQTLLSQFSSRVTVLTQACPGLADAIEDGDARIDARRDLLAKFITPLLDGGADTLVLGCTHYPLILNEIAEVAGRITDKPIQLIDTSDAIARQVVRQLNSNGIINADQTRGTITFFSSCAADDADDRKRQLEQAEAVISWYWKAGPVSVLALPI